MAAGLGGAGLTPAEWHRRFVQQAGWTADLRRYLYGRAGLEQADRVLEVGCGTGALLPELAAGGAQVVGLDLLPEFLHTAGQQEPKAMLLQADGSLLPFEANSFDLAVCHFLLLWANWPEQILAEMRRVIRPGGSVLALAEPDYGGRIDFPPALDVLGEWQMESLRRQGAHPEMGRRLAKLFNQAGFREVQTGVMGGQWQGRPAPEAIEAEWAMLRADLQGRVDANTLKRLQSTEDQAWEQGERVLYVPTFYASGVK